MSAFAGLVPGRVVERRWSRWRPGTGAVLGVVLSLVSQGLVRGNGVTGDEPNVRVDALALGRSGELYVGGRFSAAGGQSAANIAQWDGASWSALGGGTDQPVQALCVDDAGCLYAGGWFYSADGVEGTAHIARWDGRAWSSVGGGLDWPVLALAFHNGELYAGGTNSSWYSSPRIARWDGASWTGLQTLDTGNARGVFALQSLPAGLYLGGYFWARDAGAEVRNFARWDGSYLRKASSQFDNYGIISAFAADGTNLYVGGTFQGVTYANNPSQYIPGTANLAVFSGTGWASVAGDFEPVSARVEALCTGPDGLYVGGYFTRLGGVSARCIARCSGGTALALGSGIEGSVEALVATADSVFVGGDFHTAGGVTASHVARWDATGWSALVSISPPDLLVKKGTEPDAAYAVNNQYQTTPAGDQIESQFASPGCVATYAIRVENDGTSVATFLLKASETDPEHWGWAVRYNDAETTAAIRGGDGYETGILLPGTWETIVVTMMPASGMQPGETKSARVCVYANAADRTVRDSVELITTVANVVVNLVSDQADANPEDGIADVDPMTPGQQVTLRAAIQTVNACLNLDRVLFDIRGTTGAPRIAPLSPLPTITAPVTIDATSQTGGGVELDGEYAGDSTNGLHITAGRSTVRGLAICRFSQNGILIEAGGDNVIQDCRVGTDLADTPELGNGWAGVSIMNSPQNQIGGPSLGDGNVISGNRAYGVKIEGADAGRNQVLANFIGVNRAGTAALGNGMGGVLVSEASDNLIGTAAARNVISGNDGPGVEISHEGATNNCIRGNLIGTDVSGTSGLGNLDGIVLTETSGNWVGGGLAPAPNVISGNARDGVCVLRCGAAGNDIIGNLIGPDATGAASLFRPGSTGAGVLIVNSPNTRVGGTSAADRNVISANAVGVLIWGTIPGTCGGNRVQGNYIGLRAGGDAALDSRTTHGIHIKDAFGTLIGGAEPGAGNVISGNALGSGVLIEGGDALDNRVQGNRIGTDREGVLAVPNLEGVTILHASYNQIGGAAAGEGNQISGNIAGLSILWEFFTSHPTPSGNKVEGNVIGLSSYNGELGNRRRGILIRGVYGNTIGGAEPGAGNVISGNGKAPEHPRFDGAGVVIASCFSVGNTKANMLQRNLIGTDSSGRTAIPNAQAGVLLVDAIGQVIGTPGAGNVISGNGLYGIEVAHGDDNRIQANRIGTTVASNEPLPNQDAGIFLFADCNSNWIGGNEPETGNIVAFNRGAGVLIEDDTNPIVQGGRNRILSNWVFANDRLGIDLRFKDTPGGVTENDQLDSDTGPNGFQNFPALGVAVGGDETTMVGVLRSAPRQQYLVQFFANGELDSSGHGEGEDLLGVTTVTTGNDGVAAIRASFPLSVALGDYITATATDSLGSTSEFSAGVRIVADTDVDDDGVPDAIEDAGRNGGDGNWDGTLDSAQGYVAALASVNGHWVTIFSPVQRPLRSVRGADVPASPTSPGNVVFPFRFFEFTVRAQGSQQDGGTTVELRLPEAPAVETFLNYGPEPGDLTPHFYEFVFDGTTGAEIQGNTVVLHFVDGQRGDHDLEVNGEVVSSGGPALVRVPPVVTAVTPRRGDQGTTMDVTVAGATFADGAMVSFGEGVQVHATTLTSTTELSASITIATDAALGPRDVTVTNDSEQSGSLPAAFEVIPPAETVVLSLNQGWNQVSLPLNPIYQLLKVFERRPKRGADRAVGPAAAPAGREVDAGTPVYVGEVWEWMAGENGHYQPATEIQAGRGYWLYAPEAVEVQVRGSPESGAVNLLAGWNLVGPLTVVNVPVSDKLQGPCWAWDPIQGRHRTIEPPTQLQPGLAYWLYATAPVSLTLSAH